MKTGTKWVLAVGAAALVAGGGLAWAEADKPSDGGCAAGGRARWGQGFRMRLGERLGLTEEQRGQMKAVWESQRSEIQPLVDKLLSERKALREAIQAEAFNESAIRAQAAEVAAVEADLAVARAKLMQELKPLLSAEQKQRLQELKAQAEKRGAAWRERIAQRRAQE